MSLMPQKLYGLATGIGSLPYTEAGSALDIILTYLPEIPHWPQIPGGGEDEGFIRQYLGPLITRGLVKVEQGKPPYFDTGAPDWLERVTSFYTEVLSQEDRAVSEQFCFSRDNAKGFFAFLDRLTAESTGSDITYLKGQLSGPVTLGLWVTDTSMQPAFYSNELRDIMVRSLSLQTRWQARALAALGKPVILFIDDPGVYGYGQSTFVGLSREAIQESLLPLIEAAHQENALVGVHACAGLDWSVFFELPFDIVNIDVYNYFTSLLVYSAEFDKFLARGGVLAWGLVPTSAEIETETVDSLLIRLEEYIDVLLKKKVHEERLRRQLLLTPSCGTGTLSTAQTERVYSLLQDVSRQYRSRYKQLF
jgi:hypothetical protein